MSWLYLIFAGLMEIGWPWGLKLSQTPEQRLLGLTIAIVCMIVSGVFLWLAQKTIPMGTAYAVWTGIGAAGTFLLGIALYGEPALPLRLLAVTMIVGGVVLLKLAH